MRLLAAGSVPSLAPSIHFRWCQNHPKAHKKPAQCGFFVVCTSLPFPCKPKQLCVDREYIDGNRLVAIDRQQAASFQHDAETGLAVLGIAHSPASFATDDIATMRTPRVELFPNDENLSSATLTSFPLVAAYTASKTAIEGFTASLEHELKSFDVRVKLVEPGYGPSTRFTANGQQRMQGLIPAAYEAFAQRVFAGLAQITATITAADVAESVWQAANDASSQLHFAAGTDAQALAVKRRYA